MKYVILCGGIGKRCNKYSLPKPLNYIHGRHMIEYIIDNIPSKEIFIVYVSLLDQYHLREIVTNQFKTHTFHFACIDYLTRGAVESAYVGIQSFLPFLNTHENIVFIDNDNLHTFPASWRLLDGAPHYDSDFIGYSIDYEKHNFSFIEIDQQRVTNIVEKQKISDFYCCGLYGFQSVQHFVESSRTMLHENKKTLNEFYFSQLYKEHLKTGGHIVPVCIEQTRHIGSLDEIMTQHGTMHHTPLRICFDLDNTLVTYPTVPDDYTSVKPIPNMIALLQKMKKEGHTIIIHTARRMKTHNNNVGKVIQDIAATTMNTLAQFEIPYDELIFGKPYADMYIDDKAMNPYLDNVSRFGIFVKEDEYMHNKLKTNQFNTIERKGDIIVKTGPVDYLRGESYFYQQIHTAFGGRFSALFPKWFKSEQIDDNKAIRMETQYVDAIPLYYLYKNGLVTPDIVDRLLHIMQQFHSVEADTGSSVATDEQVSNNYFKKLEARFQQRDIYSFADADAVFDHIIEGLRSNYSAEIVPLIHGDFWFSNIMLNYKDDVVLIDMRGQVDGVLTLSGDKYYDYGKLLQSIVGYDLILNECTIDTEYIRTMKALYLSRCLKSGLNVDYLRFVTKGLIFGTFPFLSKNHSSSVKQRIWELIQTV